MSFLEGELDAAVEIAMSAAAAVVGAAPGGLGTAQAAAAARMKVARLSGAAGAAEVAAEAAEAKVGVFWDLVLGPGHLLAPLLGSLCGACMLDREGELWATPPRVPPVLSRSCQAAPAGSVS